MTEMQASNCPGRKTRNQRQEPPQAFHGGCVGGMYRFQPIGSQLHQEAVVWNMCCCGNKGTERTPNKEGKEQFSVRVQPLLFDRDLFVY